MSPQTIRDVMTVAPYSIQLSHSLTVARNVMRDKRVRHLPVLEGRRIVGILAERDLEMALLRPDGATASVGRAKLAEPVVVAPDVPIANAVKSMAATRADIAVVVDHERVVGVFTTIDALGVLAGLLDEAREAG